MRLPFSSTASGIIYDNETGTRIISRSVIAESGNAALTDYDYFSANGVNSNSFATTGALVYPGVNKNNLQPGAGALNSQYVMNFESYRNGVKRNWNVLQIFNTTSDYFGKWGYFYDLDRREEKEKQLTVDGSGTVTFYNENAVNNFAISGLNSFNGMRAGIATLSTYYTCAGENGNGCNIIVTANGKTCE